MNFDTITLVMILTIVGLMGLATIVGQLLRRQSDPRFDPAIIAQFNARLRWWWLMLFVLAATFLIGRTATMVLFFGLSFWALREFITLTPTRIADHRALWWIFLFTLVQYVLVGKNYYELYSIFIPVYAFLFVPVRVAIAGDFKRYLERCAKLQFGLMICVYCLSYAPALLNFEVPDKSTASLLLFFILVVTVGDAFHFAAEQLVGRRIIAPAVSASRSYEGFAAGVACSTVFGAMLWWATPFQFWQAAGMSLLITTMGFFGGLVMSAIKRDRGVEDHGTLVTGHGGVLDRIDSICFAAPIFFHVTRYLLKG